MNIGLATIYGNVYAEDRVFDPKSCTIGENLLVPGIRLKEHLEARGHSFHTVDLFEKGSLDRVIFQDIGPNDCLAIDGPVRALKYLAKRKWRQDNYLKAGRLRPEQRILIMQEPPVVNPWSYRKNLHDRFGKILTWDDDLVDNVKYFKFFYPQVVPDRRYEVPFSEKRFLTMICGNKRSSHPKELYSARREVIGFFEGREDDFDLYGFGWEQEGLKHYRGRVGRKLETLSRYRYSICYENMGGVKGYITEKIFDCFFAGVVPVYRGAENIAEVIPKETFIDRGRFSGTEELTAFLKGLGEAEYRRYIDSARDYLHSGDFRKNFSVEAYIGRIEEALFGAKEGGT